MSPDPVSARIGRAYEPGPILAGAPIRPPFTLYDLVVHPTTMNSPSVPAVALVERPVDVRDNPRQHAITPEQARLLGAQLIRAADEAEGRR